MSIVIVYALTATFSAFALYRMAQAEKRMRAAISRLEYYKREAYELAAGLRTSYMDENGNFVEIGPARGGEQK